MAAWYALIVVLAATTEPPQLVRAVVGFCLLLVLAAYCERRAGRGGLIGSIAVAPLFAAMIATDLTDLPARAVSLPGMALALVAIAFVDRGGRRAEPA